MTPQRPKAAEASHVVCTGRAFARAFTNVSGGLSDTILFADGKASLRVSNVRRRLTLPARGAPSFPSAHVIVKGSMLCATIFREM